MILYVIYVAHSRPSIKALLPFVAQLAPTWYELGVKLIEEIRLTMIKVNYGGDKQKCCLTMLQYWKETHPEATWHDLVTALKSPGVELTAVASDIEKKFTGKTLLSTVHTLYNSVFGYYVLFINLYLIFNVIIHSLLCELQLNYVDDTLLHG